MWCFDDREERQEGGKLKLWEEARAQTRAGQGRDGQQFHKQWGQSGPRGRHQLDGLQEATAWHPVLAKIPKPCS
jgi:hypothetical protein